MRFVARAGPGHIEVSYMWLPTWLGMNSVLAKEIEESIGPRFVGRELTDQVLDEAHCAVLRFLRDKYSHLHGLDDYLDGIKFVSVAEDEGRTAQPQAQQ